MLRPKRVKNGTTGASRISSVVGVAWLIFGWSRPAFPDEQPHLQFAPIQFASTVSGIIGYTLQSNTLGANTTRQQEFDLGVNVGVRARSYIWQPWLARVTGALGVNVSTSTSSYNMSPTTKSGNTALTGDVGLHVLQMSRFPFQATVYKHANQTSGFLSGLNSDYMDSGLTLNQDYRSRNGLLVSNAFYNHGISGRASFGTEEVRNQLDFNLTAQPLYSHQTFRVVGAMTSVDHPPKGENTLTNTLVTNHLYQPNSILSVASLLNLIKTSYTIAPGINPQQQSDFNSQQLSSFASWRPQESPMTVTGSVRLMRSNSSSNGIAAPQYDNTNLNLGANYAWSRFLRTYGSVNVNDNSGIQTVSTDVALAAQKGFGGRPDPINLGGFRYTRSVGASLSNATTTTSSSSSTLPASVPNQSSTTSIQRLGGTLGHDLSKYTQLGSGRLTIDMNQQISTILSSNASPFTHLNSGASLTWGRTEDRGNTMLSLRAADSRAFTGTQNYFQLINLQASRNEHLARNQSLNGNLTLQGSRSGASGVPAPFTATPSADLGYHHQRLLSVRNLTFDSTLAIVGADIVSSQNSSALLGLTNQSQGRLLWSNELNYNIGRLRLRLLTRMAKTNNVSQSSLYFSIYRTF